MDVGGSIDIRPDQLLDFAIVGVVYAQKLLGIPNPSVAILSIGSEEGKGNEFVKNSYPIFKKSGLNFIGNVEGYDIPIGKANVIVCDGFVGNIALKSSEGLAAMLYQFLKAEFTRNPLTKLAALVAYPVLRAFRRRVDPRRYNGATLIGLKGVVVKSHGGADAFAFGNALAKAHDEVTHGVLDKIAQRMAAMPVAAAASPALDVAPATASAPVAPAANA